MRLTARHFSPLYANNTAKRKNPLRKCVVCAKNDKSSQTRYTNVRTAMLVYVYIRVSKNFIQNIIIKKILFNIILYNYSYQIIV